MEPAGARRRSWSAQLVATLRRNLIIKRRQKRRTFAEIFMPIYIFAILAIVRAVQPDTFYEAVTEPHGAASVATPPFPRLLALHVAPNGSLQRDFGAELAAALNASVAFHAAPAELDRLGRDPPPDRWLAALILPERPGAPDLNYTLRIDSRARLPTFDTVGEEACRGSAAGGALEYACPANSYYYSGFLFLQNAVEALMMSRQTGRDVPPADVIIENGPRPEAEGGSVTFLRIFIPLYMAISLAQFITYLLVLIVGEKEAKIKDGLKLMGLRDSVYWLSWFLIYAVYVFVVCSICIVIMVLSKLFPYTDNIYIFIIFVLYGWSLVMFGFMISPFFTKAKVAGGVGNMAVQGISLLFLVQVFVDDLPIAAYWLMSLLSPVAFTLGIERAVELDTQKVGLVSGNLWDANGGMSFGGCIIMILVDIVLYAFLAFYLDNVLPNEYGRRESVFFIFKKSFWLGSNKSMRLLEDDDHQYVSVDQETTNADMEPVSAEMKHKAALRVFALRKEFNSGGEKLVAVNDLSLDMYEDQITAILGHNGAGKTTFFNMLTGLTMPTSGTATIYGLDITDPSDMRELWGMIGLCPQHDILLDDLTPREHLVFLATLRGIPPERVEAEVKQTLSDVDLLEKADEPVRGLSGGQKRKLSVGQALVGDPRVIILDEPTAGVDPYSRRHMWSLLQRRKKGRLMLLTTHFMDEADILADRKAIVSAGKLRCCGSSMFLKNRFGLGYHLTIVQGSTPCVDAVDGIISSYVPEREKGRVHGNELTFILPMASVSQFPALFAELESRQQQLGVQSFGVSLTTLEEVFLHLSETDSREAAGPALASVTRDVLDHRSSLSGGSPARAELRPDGESIALAERRPAPAGEPPQVQVRPSRAAAMRALLKVRLLTLLRVPAVLFFGVALPAGFMIGGLMINRLSTGTSAETDAVRLGPGTYQDKSLLYLDPSGALNQDIIDGWGIPAEPFNGSYTAMLNDSVLAGLNVTTARRMLAVISGSTVHTPAVLLNAINNGRLRDLNGSGQLELTSSPLVDAQQATFDGTVFSSSFMVGFLFLLVPCSIVMELVQERELKIRNQLRVNGLSFTTYFLSFFIVAATLFFILWVIMMVVIQAADVALLTPGPAYSMLGVLYLQYTVVGLLFASIVSYIFDKMETAMSVYPNVAMMCGILPYMLVSLLDSLVPDSEVGVILHYIFSVGNPFYLPCGALYFLSKTYITVKLAEQREVEYADYWGSPVFLIPLAVQCVQIPLLWLVLRWVDSRRTSPDSSAASCLPWPRGKKSATLEGGSLSDPAPVDEDVLAEKERVSAIIEGRHDGPAPVITVQNLCKLYRSSAKSKSDGGVLRAVGSVSFAVDAGEVFGLLGPNGAGKTTTMRMVIAEEAPTKGQIQVAGFDVKNSLSEAFHLLGYCPQFDAQWKYITVEEHLKCFAQIRGVSSADAERLTRHYIDGLQIGEHAAKRSGVCSGGTKRKLSYALSMLGRPRVVLLDEPSTGMDPQSKRFLWDTIAAGFRGERGAILTTHSMEEADALCTRLGIMVKGNLRCLGSTQHLKNKYGGGYVLEMKLDAGNDLAERIDKVQQLVRQLFPSADLEESYGERLRYKIPQSDVVSLSKGFAELEAAKTRLGMEEYSLSQTTLEQVFLRFAREQELGE